MKYGQYWKQEVKNLPEGLQTHIINYKAYKKLIKKEINISDLTDMLMKDAMYADKCFKKSPKFTGLYKFAELNSTSLYKICKKAQKKLNDENAIKWLQNVQNQRLFSFVNGIKKTELVIQQCTDCTRECPVCFEREDATIIMHCGHTLCVGCVKDMLKVRNTKGTIYNVIAHGLYVNMRGVGTACCPLCRDRMAFVDYKCVKVPPPQ